MPHTRPESTGTWEALRGRQAALDFVYVYETRTVGMDGWLPRMAALRVDMIAGKANMDAANRNLSLVASIECGGKTKKDEPKFYQQLVPMKAMAVAEKPLERFNASCRDGGQQNAAVQSVESPKSQRREVSQHNEAKCLGSTVRIERYWGH